MLGEALYKDLQGCYKFLSWKKSRFREVQALSWGRELDLEVWVLSTISTSVEEHWPSLCILGLTKSHSFIGLLCLVSAVWACESCKCIFYKSNPIFSVLREHTIYSSEFFDEGGAFFFFPTFIISVSFICFLDWRFYTHYFFWSGVLQVFVQHLILILYKLIVGMVS